MLELIGGGPVTRTLSSVRLSESVAGDKSRKVSVVVLLLAVKLMFFVSERKMVLPLRTMEKVWDKSSELPFTFTCRRCSKPL